MAAKTLQLSLSQQRMLTESEAAHYCNLPSKLFKVICTVAPVKLGNVLRFDVRDLDQWLDTMKDGSVNATHDEILGRL